MPKIYNILLIIVLLLSPSRLFALEKMGSDSRIKTMVYGQNDVFRVNSVYGFQTVVELDSEEKILTISIGNPSLFKIIPSGSRLFIKALINNQITNMTIVTDLRTYQFELTSNTEDTDENMYVVRFLYPENITTVETPYENKPMSLYNPLKIGTATTAVSIPSFSEIPSVSKAIPPVGIRNYEPEAPLSLQLNNTSNF